MNFFIFIFQPVYTHPTVTDSSTLICETGHVCHIPLTYKGVNGKWYVIILGHRITGYCVKFNDFA